MQPDQRAGRLQSGISDQEGLRMDQAQTEITKMEQAAWKYTNFGWKIHPLSDPTGGEKSSGKRPIEKGWQNRKTIRTDKEIKRFWEPGLKKLYNIGLQC